MHSRKYATPQTKIRGLGNFPSKYVQLPLKCRFFRHSHFQQYESQNEIMELDQCGHLLVSVHNCGEFNGDKFLDMESDDCGVYKFNQLKGPHRWLV